jgi:hypothetical protein
VLTSLALLIGPAGAQEAPESSEVAACQPGAGYAPGCDLGQDGDIDIFDIQRTVGQLLGLVWIVWTGILLLRRKASQDTSCQCQNGQAAQIAQS